MVGFFVSIYDYYMKGGPVMYPLLFCALLGIVFLIERYIALKRNSINAFRFIDKEVEILSDPNQEFKDRIVKLGEFCDQNHGPLPKVLRAGLEKVHRGPSEVEKAMGSSGVVQISNLERGLIVLASVANVGPLLGFLGTVTGMIRSFEAIAIAGLNNPSLVASGISEALITTATGLFIAIPVLGCYNYFVSIIGRISLEMEQVSTVLIDQVIENIHQKKVA